MSVGPEAAVRQLRNFLAEADPLRVTTERAAELVQAFVEAEKLCQAGKLLFAGRAAQGRTWVDQGHVSPAFWLADLAKAPVSDAINTLDTSKRLGQLPDTAEAVRAGKLSAPQASEVTRAATKDPSAERELLELAAGDSFKRLKDRLLQVMAQASSREDEAKRYRAVHARRSLRHYTDHEGAFRLDARLTPEAGARFMSSIQAEADAIFHAARKDGRQEPPDAYRADALMALVTGRPSAPSGTEGTRERQAGSSAPF